MEIEDQNIGIVIEVKYPDSSNLEKGCLEALEQIEKKNYTARLAEDGMETILAYGVACWKKGCRVLLGQQAVSSRIARDIPNCDTLEAIKEVQQLKNDPTKKAYDSFSETELKTGAAPRYRPAPIPVQESS